MEAIADILAPEDIKIQKLLGLPAGIMRDLLPKSPVYMKDIFVLFDYQNKIVRFIVKSIKYKNNANLRKRIAGYLYEEILDLSSEIALFEGAPPLLVPMPMSKKEKRNRGFNQCEELVREIKKIGGDNIEVSYNTLKKVRETERQTKLSREERALNVEGSMCAFLKSPSNFSGLNDKATIKMQRPDQSVGKAKTVIVLDDVYTTGASLAEARRALLSAGASRVIGLFIAH
jgi:predicted amidophosphoribosyltransferase